MQKKEKKNVVKAFDIIWDFDMDEVYERLDDMTAKQASESLGIPYDQYANMTTEERHDWAYDLFHHNRVCLDEFMNLPEEIEIPYDLVGDDDLITEWISDEYGFCIRGYKLTTDKMTA